MPRVIRETITLIRVERWILADDGEPRPEGAPAPERVIEQFVVTTADEALVRELLQRLLAWRDGGG